MKYTAATWGAEGVLAEGRVSDKTRIPAPEGPDSQPSARGSTGEQNFPSAQGGITVVRPSVSPAQSHRRTVKPQTGTGLQYGNLRQQESAPDLECPGVQNSYHAPGVPESAPNLTVPAPSQVWGAKRGVGWMAQR